MVYLPPLRFALFAFLGATGIFPAFSAVSFGPAVSYPAQSFVGATKTADFNHDGILDIVISESVPRTVSIYLGNGTGAFAYSASSSAAALTGASSGEVAPGDFNGDGHLDVALAHPSSTGLPNGFGNKVTIHLGNGLGGFLPGPLVFATGGSNTGLASADLNGDGKADLVVGSMDSGQVYSYLSNGNGTFTLFASYNTGSPYGGQGNAVSLADMNLDGRLDIVTNNISHGSLSVLLGNGVGGFSLHGVFSTGVGGVQFAPGDFDNDGKLDVIASSNSTGPTILKGDGLGGLTPFSVFASPNTAGGLVVADVDGDGNLDAFLAGGPLGSAVLLLGAGNGQIASRTDFALGTYIPALTAGDFNGDGKPDLAATDQFTVIVRLNTTAPADSTPPTISPNVTGTLGSHNWYTSNVNVTWSVNDPESAITSSTGCGATAISADTAGVTLTCSATSTGGTDSQSVTIKRDATPPSVVVTGVSNGGSYPLGAVPVAGCSTADSMSGVAANATPNVTGGTTNGIGNLTATCSGAIDNAGNTAAPVSVTYSVQYNFLGFFAPINMGIWNSLKAGQAAPMKWQLQDSASNHISALSAVSSITSANVACTAGTVDPVETADAAGASGLRYDLSSNQYIFTWKTEKSWAGTCRRFFVKFDDGTTKTADFQLK